MPQEGICRAFSPLYLVHVLTWGCAPGWYISRRWPFDEFVMEEPSPYSYSSRLAVLPIEQIAHCIATRGLGFTLALGVEIIDGRV